jgi:hypothetical protein
VAPNKREVTLGPLNSSSDKTLFHENRTIQ